MVSRVRSPDEPPKRLVTSVTGLFRTINSPYLPEMAKFQGFHNRIVKRSGASGLSFGEKLGYRLGYFFES